MGQCGAEPICYQVVCHVAREGGCKISTSVGPLHSQWRSGHLPYFILQPYAVIHTRGAGWKQRPLKSESNTVIHYSSHIKKTARKQSKIPRMHWATGHVLFTNVKSATSLFVSFMFSGYEVLRMCWLSPGACDYLKWDLNNDLDLKWLIPSKHQRLCNSFPTGVSLIFPKLH